MTKKFDKLNETFNVDGDIIPVESETVIEKVEKISLVVDDFKKDYRNLLDNHIKIIRQPVEEVYGTVAVFEDLYGNQWDLIEPK